MSLITLEALVADHERLGAQIEQFKNQQQPRSLVLPGITIDLRQGEHYAGAVLDETGAVKHHLVLMAAKPDGLLDWSDAMEWADDVGGFLPTRQEQALLYANCKAQFESAWYWSGEEHENASVAWGCSFYDGYQINYHKSSAERCRAVRRVS